MASKSTASTIPNNIIAIFDTPPEDTRPAADYLSPSALQHFKTYKYSAVDKSPVSHYILRHYWNACVELLPLWLAPNMVTLLGFLFILFNIGLLSYTDPNLTGPSSPWVCYSYAFGVWMYSTMDNIDGKQARRTGTSSGLGELFDHGIDSLNCTLASLLMTSALGLGSTPIGAFTAIVPTLPMFFSTWETFHTHTLFLGYFNGPTEGLILAAATMWASGFFGRETWREPISQLSPVIGNFIGEKTTVLDLWTPIVLSAFFIAHLPSCIYNVHHALRAQNRAFLPTLQNWTPMLVFCSALIAWLGSPASTLLSDNHLTLLCLTLSLVFGRMTTKMILAHLTRQPFPHWTALLVPLIGGAMGTNAGVLGLQPLTGKAEHYYLLGYFGVAAVVYFRWAYLVITAICAYLDIPCLTIREEKWRAAEKERERKEGKKSR